jgi:hypothetical protein
MTTPDERRRNLIWGRETLEELSLDSGLPVAWRVEAAGLLNRYPALDFLQQFDAGNRAELEAHAAVLFKARSLFQQIAASPTCSAQRRYTLTVVLRHFD